MKFIKYFTAYIFLSIMFFNSCTKNTFDSKEYTLTFENKTSLSLNVSCPFDGFDSFSIKSGEIKKVKSENSYVIIVDISHPPTSKIIDYKNKFDDYLIFYEYDYTIEYRISGSAKSVDVTLNNSSGGTEQYSNVSVPQSYRYKNFYDDFLYISAQNQGQIGSVTVQIYYKGELFKSATSSGAYVIATASGVI